MALPPDVLRVLAPLMGLLGGQEADAQIRHVAVKKMRQQMKDDRISDLKTWLLAKKHLGPDALVVARPGLGNAYYTRTRDGRPTIVYDPKFKSRSVIGHEIGHGVREREGRLTSALYGPSIALGPSTSTAGALLAGASRSYRPIGLGLAAAGVGISTPHLLEEGGATTKAQEIVGPTVGTGPALATYLSGALAAPAAAGGLTLLFKKLLSRGR